MKNLKLFLLSIIFLLSFSTGIKAEYFSDIIITSANGIWTDSRTFSTLNAAVTAVGANVRTIKIAKPQVVTSLTIPSNITLEFDRDGSITNSAQLTIQTKNIIAPNRQIFTGVGDIDFASGTIVQTGWFSNIETAFTLTSNDTVTLIVSKAQTVTASYSPGTNVNLKWDSPGNILTVNAGVTISNIGQVEAGNYQLFAGAGNFRFRDGTNLNLSWFANLRSSISHISTNKVTLIINGSFTEDYIDTVVATTTLQFNNGGVLTVTAGQVLTINGIVICNPGVQIFSVSTTNQVLGLSHATPQMFGTGTSAVQYAFDSVAVGGTVEILPGTTVFSSAIARIVGMTVKGSGWGCVLSTTTVIDNTLTAPVIKVAKSNITLKDFKLTWETMPDSPQYMGSSGENQDTLVVGYNYNAFASPPDRVDNVMVDHVYVLGGKQHGIWVGYSKGVTIKNCRTEEIYATQINGWEASDFSVINNYLYRSQDVGIDTGSSLVETSPGSGVYTQSWLGDNVLIQGNIIVDSMVGIGSHGGRNVVISDNLIDRTWTTAISSQSSDYYGISHSEGIIISNNVIRRPFQFYGAGNFHPLNYYATTSGSVPTIWAASTASSSLGASGRGDVTIVDNIIDDDLPAVESIYYQGVWASGRNVIIAGNNFSFGFGTALYLAPAVATDYDLIDNLIIANNLIKITEGNGYSMMNLIGVAKGSVTGNVFGCGGTGRATIQGRFVVAEYAKDVIFTGNNVTGVNTSNEDFVASSSPVNTPNITMMPEHNTGLTYGNSYTWYSVSTDLANVGNRINITGKYIGKRVWNNTTKKWVYAVGPLAADVWNDAVGALAHTPI